VGGPAPGPNHSGWRRPLPPGSHSCHGRERGVVEGLPHIFLTMKEEAERVRRGEVAGPSNQGDGDGGGGGGRRYRRRLCPPMPPGPLAALRGGEVGALARGPGKFIPGLRQGAPPPSRRDQSNGPPTMNTDPATVMGRGKRPVKFIAGCDPLPGIKHEEVRGEGDPKAGWNVPTAPRMSSHPNDTHIGRPRSHARQRERPT